MFRLWQWHQIPGNPLILINKSQSQLYRVDSPLLPREKVLVVTEILVSRSSVFQHNHQSLQCATKNIKLLVRVDFQCNFNKVPITVWQNLNCKKFCKIKTKLNLYLLHTDISSRAISITKKNLNYYKWIDWLSYVWFRFFIFFIQTSSSQHHICCSCPFNLTISCTRLRQKNSIQWLDALRLMAYSHCRTRIRTRTRIGPRDRYLSLKWVQ